MFAQCLAEQAARQGERPFLLFEGRVITWRELRDTVSRTATLLSDRQIAAGDRVLLAAENSPSFIYLWFALRWAGATCVPLHTAAPSTAIAKMVADGGLTHLVGDTALRARVTDVAPQLADASITFTNAAELERVVANLTPARPHPAGRYHESSLLYTSGTTGEPKGVVLCDEALLAGGRQLAATLKITEADRIMLGLPLFHTNPQVYGVMTALATGCSVAVLREFRPEIFLSAAVEAGATGFTYVGTFLSLLLKKTSNVPKHALRFCVGGGAPEPLWRDVEHKLRVPVHELYGMTETGGWVSATAVDRRRVGSCGTVRPDMECAILDADDHRLPPGQVGQIAVRPNAPGVLFDGYHARPELTLSRWRNAWFHTGDLGRFDDDGYLYFHGRADELIRRGGENVSPTDVELVLAEYPAISEVAVVGVPDHTMGEEVKAVVVPGAGFDATDLPRFLDERLPRFAWPRYVELREALPKTPTQKVQRAELRATGPEVIDLRGWSTRTWGAR